MVELRKGFFAVGGTVPRDAPSYVVRDADAELAAALRDGQFCHVLTSRQMGKSSLMVRTVSSLRQEGRACVVLDLTAIGQNVTEEQWYDGLLNLVAAQFDLQDRMDDFWRRSARLGPLQRFFTAIERVVLAHVPGSVIVFVDEIDAVRSLPFSSDGFFAAIRACLNRRVEESEFRRLTFCLLGVARPADLIRDERTTPFNAGQRIELTDFTLAEALPLCLGFDLPAPAARAIMARVLHWTGGHPYLTQQLCARIAADTRARTDADVDRIANETFLSGKAQLRDDNLLFVRDRILSRDTPRVETLMLYSRVLSRRRVEDDPADRLVSALKLSGVVKSVEGALQVRNRIYRTVFDGAWIAQHLPDAEIRRQRQAYLRGVAGTSIGAAAVIAVVAGLALRSFMLARQADLLANEREGALRATASERDRAGAMRSAAERSAARERTAAEKAREAVRRERSERQRQERAVHTERAALSRERAALSREGEALQQARTQHDMAERAAALAKEEALNARRGYYASTITQVWNDYENSARRPENLGSARALLESLRPQAGQVDLRGFEWYWLYRVCHQSVTRLAGHTGDVRALAWSPDGRMFASGSYDSTVVVWDARTGGKIARISCYPMRVIAVAWSPDSKTLAFCGSSKVATLWSLANRRAVATCRGHSEDVNDMAFSPDGTLLATASDDGTTRLWNAHTGAAIATLPAPNRKSATPYGDWMKCVAFTPEGDRLLAGCRDGTVTCWELATRKAIAVVDAQPPDGMGVNHAIWIERGEVLTVGGGPAAIDQGVFEQAYRLRTTLDEHGGTMAMGATPDRRMIVLGGPAGIARIMKDRRLSTELRGETGEIYAAAISPDGSSVALGGEDGELAIWRLSVRPTMSTSDRISPEHPMRTLWLATDGRYLGMQYESGPAFSAQVVDVARDQAIGRTLLPVGAITPYRDRPSRDGARLALATNRGPMVLDLRGPRRRAVRLPPCDVFRADWSADGKTIAAAARTGPSAEIVIVDSDTGRIVRRVRAPAPEIGAVKYSPDGRTLATITTDRPSRILVYSADLTRLRYQLRADGASDMRFSPDSRLFAVRAGREIKVYDTATARRISALHTTLGEPKAFAFSGDHQTLAAVDGERVRLYQTASGQPMIDLPATADRPIEAVRKQAYAVDFACDGHALWLSRTYGVTTTFTAASPSETR